MSLLRVGNYTDCLIYCEHRVRELAAASLLAQFLAQSNFTTAILPVHFRRYISVIKHRPRLVIIPYCYTDKETLFYRRFDTLYGTVTLPVNLHHEQIASEAGRASLMPQYKAARDIIHISWGKKFATQLIDARVQPDNIYIVGNPRLDFLHERFAAVCPKEHLARRFAIPNDRPWVLIPMNFGFAHFTDEYLEGLRSRGWCNVDSQRTLTIKSLTPFLVGIKQIAVTQPQVQFILRPHPMESFDEYNRLCSELVLAKAGNIKLIRQLPVSFWIHVSDAVIVWDSTTAIESSAAGKPTVRFEPIQIPQWARRDFFDMLPTARDSSQLCDMLQQTLKAQPKLSAQMKSYLESRFYKTDGMATFRLALVIRELLRNHGGRGPEQKATWNLRKAFWLLGKSVSRDFPKEIMVHLGLLGKIVPFYSGLQEDNFRGQDIEHLRKLLMPFVDAPSDAEIVLQKTSCGQLVSFK